MENYDKIKLVFGLGNPGKKFKNTPHNFGRDLVEFCISSVKANLLLEDYHFKIFNWGNLNFLVSNKFMNQSGEVLKKTLNILKISTKEVLLIQDEADLPFLWIKITFNKGSSKHKGIESIYKLCGNEIWRFRIGFQLEKRQKAENLVLKKIDKEKLKLWSKSKSRFLEIINKLQNTPINKLNISSKYLVE
jgi:PTH1 family peptidyl-tRNA hydrolase